MSWPVLGGPAGLGLTGVLPPGGELRFGGWAAAGEDEGMAGGQAADPGAARSTCRPVRGAQSGWRAGSRGPGRSGAGGQLSMASRVWVGGSCCQPCPASTLARPVVAQPRASSVAAATPRPRVSRSLPVRVSLRPLTRNLLAGLGSAAGRRRWVGWRRGSDRNPRRVRPGRALRCWARRPSGPCPGRSRRA